MQDANRDLFVTEATAQQYAAIASLINAPLLDTAFKRHEKAAQKAKRQYHKLGQLAILLVALSAIFTIAEALILESLLSNVVLTMAAAVMAGVGIVLQCYLIWTKQKPKWLVNRFAAERIRSLKFQAFALAHQAKDAQELKSMSEEFAARKLSELENELNTGIAVLKNFMPKPLVTDIKTRGAPKNAALAELAQRAYDELRIQYQRNFALSEITHFTGRRRIFNSSQDMIYLAAAVFAFLSLGAKIAARLGLDIETGWIDFLAVSLFVLGATEAIMDNATLEEQSQTRFEQYVRDIEEIMERAKTNSRLGDVIRPMELICLNELDHFCRAADRISYRF